MAADRARIATLYLKGWSQYAIASEMGMTRELVRYDIHAIEDEWKKGALVDFDAAKERELRKIDLIEQELWLAWEGSKAAQEQTSSRQRKRELQFAAAGGEQMVPLDRTTEVHKRTAQRDPAAEFMARIQWCVEMRCKILGLIAPTELRHSGTVSQITEVYYEPTPGAPDARLVIIGGGAAPALGPPDDAPDGREVG
jgi:hypothetical protein